MTDPDLPIPPDPPLHPLPSLGAEDEGEQLRMFEDHPEVDPPPFSTEPSSAEEAAPPQDLFDREPLWEEGGDLPGALEAILLASGEVLDLKRMQELTGIHEGPLRQALEKLQERLQPPRGVRLLEVAGGWRMATAAEYGTLVAKLVTTIRSGKLTQAQIETLAIVAYRQPITIPEVNEIRGVTSGANQVRSLLERELIQPIGRKTVVGRPMMYGTTQTFLLHFGLKSLNDLPRLADFGETTLEARALATLGAPEMPEDGLFGEPGEVLTTELPPAAEFVLPDAPEETPGPPAPPAVESSQA